MDDNVKVPVRSKPDKLPRAYDRYKCVICLEDMLHQCLTKDGIPR